MRIRLFALILALLLVASLAACSAKDEAAQQPVPDQATAQAAPGDADQAAPDADQAAEAPRAIQEVIPSGPLGQVQLRNGTTLKIDALQKLGGQYWVYVVGKLNGRSSTVVSLTRFRDLMNWKSIVFTDPQTFTITSRQGKEWAFQDAAFYLGSDKVDSYVFYTLNDRFDQVLTEVRKDEVATIDFTVR